MMEPFNDFLNKIENDDHRQKLIDLLQWIIDTYPNLTPEFKWNQPMFTHNGTFIIAFSTAKRHVAVAPEKVALDRFADTLTEAGYSYSSQIFRMKWNQPFDYDLIKKIIDFNIEDKKDDKTFWRK